MSGFHTTVRNSRCSRKTKTIQKKVSPSLILGSGILATPPNKNERLEFMLPMWLQIPSSPLYFALVVVMSRKVGRREYMTGSS